ncbi:hypothetical protein [Micromonospora sp. NPDC001898]|uniref:hypothetical protein n=1 Tax=Micromonospora sp. NPDC001898 TaxID=3364221 RepID=UPI0036CE0B13
MSEPSRLRTVELERIDSPPPPVRLGLVAAVEEALAKAGRTSTPEGAIALRLAETLDDAGHTASGIAALAKQLHASLDAALMGAEESGDEVDELKERRERRRRA